MPDKQDDIATINDGLPRLQAIIGQWGIDADLHFVAGLLLALIRTQDFMRHEVITAGPDKTIDVPSGVVYAVTTAGYEGKD